MRAKLIMYARNLRRHGRNSADAAGMSRRGSGN